MSQAYGVGMQGSSQSTGGGQLHSQHESKHRALAAFHDQDQGSGGPAGMGMSGGTDHGAGGSGLPSLPSQGVSYGMPNYGAGAGASQGSSAGMGMGMGMGIGGMPSSMMTSAPAPLEGGYAGRFAGASAAVAAARTGGGRLGAGGIGGPSTSSPYGHPGGGSSGSHGHGYKSYGSSSSPRVPSGSGTGAGMGGIGGSGAGHSHRSRPSPLGSGTRGTGGGSLGSSGMPGSDLLPMRKKSPLDALGVELGSVGQHQSRKPNRHERARQGQRPGRLSSPASLYDLSGIKQPKGHGPVRAGPGVLGGLGGMAGVSGARAGGRALQPIGGGGIGMGQHRSPVSSFGTDPGSMGMGTGMGMGSGAVSHGRRAGHSGALSPLADASKYRYGKQAGGT